jgi:hypothetical protein
MNSTKIFALIVSAIAFFPSASWADEMSINQEINMNSTTSGNGRVTSIETNQQHSVQSSPQSRYSRKNTRIYHTINCRAANAGTISARKRFKKQLMDKIMREQIIQQRAQIED